jgi:hypothetical protein
LTNLTPQEILSQIMTWLEEEDEYEITPENNPKSHFSFNVKFKKRKKVFPMVITYPKEFKIDDVIIIGWGWNWEEEDKKSFRAITDRELKLNLFDSIIKNTSRLSRVDLAIRNYNLEGIKAYKFLRISELTKPNVILYLEQLVLVLKIIVKEFEYHKMHGGIFNPSDFV